MNTDTTLRIHGTTPSFTPKSFSRSSGAYTKDSKTSLEKVSPPTDSPVAHSKPKADNGSLDEQPNDHHTRTAIEKEKNEVKLVQLHLMKSHHTCKKPKKRF